MATKGALTTTFALSAEKYTGAGQPTEATYDAYTWTDCGEVTNVGEFGREYQAVRTNNLASGATRKAKGSYDNGTIQLDLLFDASDAGQTLLEAAAVSTSHYSFRVQLPGEAGDKQDFFFGGLVMGLKKIVGGPNDAIMLRTSIEVNHYDVIEGTR